MNEAATGRLRAKRDPSATIVKARSVEDSIGETNELVSDSASFAAIGVLADSGAVLCVRPSRSARSQVCRGAVNGSTICSANHIARKCLSRGDT